MNLRTAILLPVLWTIGTNAAAIRPVFDHATGDNRITNGTVVKEGDAPFLVKLIFVNGDRYSLCGGTIIDDSTVVTAGHCVHDRSNGQVRSPDDTYIFYGSNQASNTKYFQPTEVILHPEYNPQDFRNDIAVLRFPAINFTPRMVEPIPIYNKDMKPKQAMEIYGWGTTRSHGTSSDNPLSLLTQTVYISEPQACQVIEPRYSSANGMQICTDANYSVGVDACQGDSGTGSTIKDGDKEYFVGLVSYGTNRYGEATCGEAGSFGMYTHVTYYLPWIKSLGGTYTLGPAGTQPSSSPTPTSTSPPAPKPTQTCYFIFICF
ncbi:hypothetical protein H4R22_001001 [Coemansia sp. RSA 1290]|nr:hypothetical protein H4R22_001001 [Coemansia sp. RSA 1290]